jgi:phosphoglycolate phosphatase
MPYREPDNHQIPQCRNHEISLVVFDLDGTLIDSRRDLADAANALIVERGGTPLPVDAIAGMVGEGAALLVRRALRAAHIEREDLAAALARFLELYDERLLAHTRLYDGTAAMLAALAPDAELAVLTNKPQRPTERILDGLGVASFFTRVVGGDTPYGRKPDPAGLHYLMSAAGATPTQTVLVGDSAIDLRTARAAATRVCLVRYGFGFATAQRELRGDEVLVDAPRHLPMALRNGDSA